MKNGEISTIFQREVLPNLFLNNSTIFFNAFNEGPDNVKALLMNLWAEIEGACGSCNAEEYMGMHEVAPEMSVWVDDLVDPDTKEPIEIKDGAIGEGIITSLNREALPLLKYGLGDVIQVFTKPCTCGYPGPGYRMKVVGRSDDLLIVKGVNVYPAVIKDLVSSFSPRVTGHLRIVLNEPPPRVVPPLKLKVEFGYNVSEAEREGLKKDIEEKLHQILKIRPEIELIPPETLERTVGKTKLIEKTYETN